MDWFKIGKGIQGCILSSCTFNLYSEYIMWGARLNKSQAVIKISRRNINNFRHVDNIILMAEWRGTKEPLEVKEESEKAGLKLNIQKTKITASSRITS